MFIVLCLDKGTKIFFWQINTIIFFFFFLLLTMASCPQKIFLLACGSFNPVTNMHLRLFGKWFNFLWRNRVFFQNLLTDARISSWKKNSCFIYTNYSRKISERLLLDFNRWMSLQNYFAKLCIFSPFLRIFKHSKRFVLVHL